MSCVTLAENKAAQPALHAYAKDYREERMDQEDRNKVEIYYRKTRSQLARAIKKLTISESSCNESVREKRLDSNHNSGTRLPEIKIKKFSGNHTEWESFYNLFKTSVLENPQLKSDAEKLYYLKSYLESDALHIVDVLQVNDRNLQVAINLLRETYENKTKIVHVYFSELLNIPQLSKHNPTELSKFATICRRNWTLLQNLELDHKVLLEALITYLYQQKLDHGFKKEFEKCRNRDTLPTVDEFLQFLKEEIEILDNATCKTSQSQTSQNSFSHKRSQSKVAFHSQSQPKFNKNSNNQSSHLKNNSIKQNQNMDGCVMCSDTAHKIYTCETFLSLPITKRNEFAKTKTLCDRPSTSQSIQENQARPNSSSLSALSIKNNLVLLATAQATIYNRQNQPVRVRILLDNGSQNSFISKKLVQKLNYTPYKKILNISGISETSTLSNEMLDIVLHSNVDPSKNFEISCAVLEKITTTIPQVKVNVDHITIPSRIVNKLADKTFATPGKIDLLIGADVYYELLTYGLIKLGDGLPTLFNTHLGYVISGRLNSQQESKNSHTISYHVASETEDPNPDTELQNTLCKFWEIEELPNLKSLSTEDELSEFIFKTTTKILPNGHFQVDIPSQNTKRHAKYVPLSSQNSRCENKYFIPHLPVYRQDRVTTKLRVVFDASCKTSSGYALNEICLKGYQTQPNLYDILCRFRTFKYALIVDLEKMFRQIRINPKDLFLQNILWRDSAKEPLKCIELQTITYGMNCSPFLSTRILNEIASTNKNLPLASDAVLTQTYVDDILTGCDLTESLEKLYLELKSMLEPAGFHLHKWGSNSQTFLKKISQTRITEFDINLDQSPSKVLGVKWNPISDEFQISVPTELVSEDNITKRNILSHISQCYDPLGFVNPAIVKGKMLMQKIWKLKCNWDDKITDKEINRKWQEFLSTICQIKDLRIPRLIFNNKEISKIELHSFSDASTEAYGACVYIRTIYTDKTVSCVLISAKSRVAPLKTITIPRLELCGMLLSANLTQGVKNILEPKVDINSVNLWTDSQIALCWCKSHPSRWSTFVSNRVAKIQALTTNFQWRHVGSSDNPADLLSRGKFTPEIYSMWFNGPKLLNEFSSGFPQYEINKNLVNVPEERKHVRLGHAGGQNVLSNVRLRYWPLNGLRQIKQIIRDCKVCYRLNAQTARQIMADLPKDRVTYSRPFQKVGVDFGGPFFIKSSTLRKAPVTKCYIAIFVCMATKAVHIELVSNLTTDAFIAALKRFGARRGNPTVIYSDNATNFLGARNQLRELYKHFQKNEFSDAIQNYLTQNETQWKFIPPRSPHWGGIWEAAIKSAKYHIARLIGLTKLTFEQFSTILSQIEAILNSRPLSALCNDPSDFQYLTSGDFLIGSSLTAYPEKDLTHAPENRLKFWQQCAKTQQLFWKRWSVDYLNRLQNRPKWLKTYENLQTNDLVLLKEENVPPLNWPMARIIEAISGPDGKVRVVRLKTKTGETTRAITKLCPLPKQDTVSCEGHN
ncbi:uncharacterized protein LOC130896573 [Diorhabda carinulata]|uniref:uncharacterized protein LOC130896573 n=1 Tax=Diorhabda carinulata TaxID=1163345 RepID=UPI0025A0B9A1|nr:uncharacterized protein LOC130896573 [Diorhabda carinulata]